MCFFIPLFKSLFRIIFSIIFRASTRPIEEKNNFTEFSAKAFSSKIRLYTDPGLSYPGFEQPSQEGR